MDSSQQRDRMEAWGERDSNVAKWSWASPLHQGDAQFLAFSGPLHFALETYG